MRFEGIIAKWNDERGFGFIQTSQGKEDIFFHIKVFKGEGQRPHVGQRVTFVEEKGKNGKLRAKVVCPCGISGLDAYGRGVPAQPTVRRSPPHKPAKQRQQKSQKQRAGRQQTTELKGWWVILAFTLLYLFAAVWWSAPWWIACFYVAASIVTFGVYAFDKSAAVKGHWRVAESTLLLLGVAGGWPGAIVAQQTLRHKSIKASFRQAFWLTVTINIIAFVCLASPLREFITAP